MRTTRALFFAATASMLFSACICNDLDTALDAARRKFDAGSGTGGGEGGGQGGGAGGGAGGGGSQDAGIPELTFLNSLPSPVTVGQCHPFPLSLETKLGSQARVNSSDVSVRLAPTNVTLHTDSSCAPPAITQQDIPARGSATLYVKGSASGTGIIVASDDSGAYARAVINDISVLPPGLSDGGVPGPSLFFATVLGGNMELGECQMLELTTVWADGGIHTVGFLAAIDAPRFKVFVNGDCGSGTNSNQVFLPAGSSADIYVKALTEGAGVIRANAPGYDGGLAGTNIVPGLVANLNFVAKPSNVAAGACSSAITVEQRNQYGAVIGPAGRLLASPFGNNGGMPSLYAGPLCTTQLDGGITMAQGQTQATFYLLDQRAEDVSINVQRDNASNSDDVTVVAGPPARLLATPATAIAPAAYACQFFSIDVVDAFGNPTTVTSNTPVSVSYPPGSAGQFQVFGNSAPCDPSDRFEAAVRTLFPGSSLDVTAHSDGGTFTATFNATHNSTPLQAATYTLTSPSSGAGGGGGGGAGGGSGGGVVGGPTGLAWGLGAYAPPAGACEETVVRTVDGSGNSVPTSTTVSLTINSDAPVDVVFAATCADIASGGGLSTYATAIAALDSDVPVAFRRAVNPVTAFRITASDNNANFAPVSANVTPLPPAMGGRGHKLEWDSSTYPGTGCVETYVWLKDNLGTPLYDGGIVNFFVSSDGGSAVTFAARCDGGTTNAFAIPARYPNAPVALRRVANGGMPYGILAMAPPGYDSASASVPPGGAPCIPPGGTCSGTYPCCLSASLNVCSGSFVCCGGPGAPVGADRCNFCCGPQTTCMTTGYCQ